MTEYVCPSCGHALEGQVRTFEVRQRIALHRQEHARVEKRRAQWRESKRRKRMLHPDLVVGWLHSLSCSGKRHAGNAKCVPIPCYSRPPLRVA